MASEQQSEIYTSDQGVETERSDAGGTMYTEQSTEQEIEEDDDMDEKYPKLRSSEENEEQKQKYKEYLDIIKEIEAQNNSLYRMKNRILELCKKPCKTACDEKEIRDLRSFMESEHLKLCCLLRTAVQLQNFGAHRRWEEIPIPTTFDEDNLLPYVTTTSPSKYINPIPCSSEDSTIEMPCPCQECHDNKNKKSPKPCKKVCMEENSEDEYIREILCGLKKLKITCPKDKKLLCEVIQTLCKKKSLPCPICPKPCPPPCAKARTIPKSMPCSHDDDNDDVLEHLKSKVCGMQQAVENIKREIMKRQRGQAIGDNRRPCPCMDDKEIDPLIECGGKLNAKSAQIEKLKESYCYLLSEYAKKEAELKQFKAKAANAPIPSDSSKQDMDESELCILRAHVSELKEEQQEFKCIMKEQAIQLEDYRNKYISAQQKVEEQCVLLEKLNMNNKRIEKQINCEVKEIRDKFQEKLTELLHFPKLLENEQLKVAELTKQKDDIEQKLIIVCKELSAMREQNTPKETKDLGPKLAKCEADCEELQRKVCELQKQRDLYCEQLRRTQDDLDTLRSESAKIIARTKERTELIRQQQQECINKLEKELAQCRATACLSVSDREAVIREMQGQLNTLAFSFDSAQKQIKTLRNHIAYVSNENCYPVKCQ